MSEAITTPLEIQEHPIIRRLAHWLLVVAMIVMIGSGWRIYNNVPIFDFTFPLSLTLGGQPDPSYALHNESGTASAIAWHFAGMWLLLFSFALFLLHGLVTGHFARDYIPVGPRAFLRDFWAAARFKLAHQLGMYNAVQRAFYIGVLIAILAMILSGLAIWKPVQLYPLTWLCGGFAAARVVHFTFMSLIVLFMVVHVALVLLVPKTFVAMTLGRATSRSHGGRA